MATLWDPRDLLDVYPDHDSFTCVGYARTTGRRCRQSFIANKDKAKAALILNRLAFEDPRSRVVMIGLKKLAELTLCPRWHRADQVSSQTAEWLSIIEDNCPRDVPARQRTTLRRIPSEEVIEVVSSRGYSRRTAVATVPVVTIPTPSPSPPTTPERRRITWFPEPAPPAPVPASRVRSAAPVAASALRTPPVSPSRVWTTAQLEDRPTTTRAPAHTSAYGITVASSVTAAITTPEAVQVNTTTTRESTPPPAALAVVTRALAVPVAALTPAVANVVAALTAVATLAAPSPTVTTATPPPLAVTTPTPSATRHTNTITAGSSTTTTTRPPTTNRSLRQRPITTFFRPLPRPGSQAPPATPASPPCPNHTLRKPLDDECPVCQEDICCSDDALWCRAQCGQNLHRSCFRIWKEQCEADERPVSCPWCRANWQWEWEA